MRLQQDRNSRYAEGNAEEYSNGLGSGLSVLKFANIESLNERATNRRNRLRDQQLQLQQSQLEEEKQKGIVYDIDFEKSDFDAGQVLIDNIDYSTIPRDRNLWRDLQVGRDFGMPGLKLGKKLVKFAKQMALKSLALKMITTLMLQGSSAVTLFFRSLNLRNTETTFLRWSKEQTNDEQQHLMLVVGFYDVLRNEMALVKKTEIPLFHYGTSKYFKVPLELEITIVDNGDDNLSLQMQIQQELTFDLVLKDIMVPISESFCLYLFGETGSPLTFVIPGVTDEVYVKKFYLALIDRVHGFDNIQGSPATTYKCCDCVIF